jgi:TolB protein
MAPSLSQLAAMRRLAHIYRRILLLAVPAALAGCGDSGDVLAPESPEAAGEVPAAEAVAPEAFTSAATLSRIVYTSYVSPSGADIWTMSPTGTGMTRLTSFTGEENRPVWSPDHSRIAFVRFRNYMRDIYLMNADGTNGHWALTTPSGYFVTSPSWSPDGKSILVQIWIQTGRSYIAKIDVASRQWSLLAPASYYGLQGRDPVYSKDGKWIYYVAATGYQVRRFQPYGQDALVEGFSASVSDLAFSPDGTKLAYFLYVGTGNNEIFVEDLTVHKTKRLTTDSHHDFHPAWSPDGSQIAFVSDRSGKRQIYTMNSSAGGSLKKITSKTTAADDPSWYR